jgi:hypothetical protein
MLRVNRSSPVRALASSRMPRRASAVRAGSTAPLRAAPNPWANCEIASGHANRSESTAAGRRGTIAAASRLAGGAGAYRAWHDAR